MDYFYVASGSGNKGLSDFYLKSKISPSPKLTLNADLHQFASASAINDEAGTGLKKSLGTELDITGLFQITSNAAIELGYALFLNTPTLVSPKVKNIPGARKSANWAYLMVHIKLP